MTMWPILIFDSDSNDVVSSSIGNVGPGEPNANEFQSPPGSENLDSVEVKAFCGPETLDAHSKSPKCESTITSLVDKHIAYEKRGDDSARLTEDVSVQIDLLAILQCDRAPLYLYQEDWKWAQSSYDRKVSFRSKGMRESVIKRLLTQYNLFGKSTLSFHLVWK